ncbi:hypothetical protein FYV02_003719 [Escherichia coli]|nr:hypothetical protein [Escherichia coli]
MKKCDPLDDFSHLDRKREICIDTSVDNKREICIDTPVKKTSPLDTIVIIFAAGAVALPLLLGFAALAYATYQETPSIFSSEFWSTSTKG